MSIPPMYLIFAVVAVVVLLAMIGAGSRQGRKAPASAVPDHLPVSVKPRFFSRSEQALYTALTEVLHGSDYTVFPNVRLNDIFKIDVKDAERQSAYARLRDKHVDFLIVALDEHQPVVAIELDGDSHKAAVQQKRDRVKDTAFRSAGLPLLRLDAGHKHTADSLFTVLLPHLGRAE